MLKIIIFIFISLNLFAEDLTNSFLTSNPTNIYKDNNTPKTINNNTYVDTWTMNVIKNNYNNNNVVEVAKHVNFLSTPSNNKIKTFTKNTNINKNNYNNSTKVNNFYLTGFCIVPNKVLVSRLSATVVLNCNFNNNKNGKLTVLFVPDLYSKALIAQPLYVTFNDIKNKRFFVKSGILMNAAQTSLNIASVVNDRKIEQFLAKTSIDSANIVTQNAMAYLQDRIKSRKQTKIVYLKDQNGNIVPVQQQENQPPKISDYIAVSALQLLSNIVKNAGNIFYEDLPYLFMVKKDTMLYADLYLTNQPQGLPSFSIPTNNIIVKNPPYSKQQPSSVLLTPVEVKGKR